MLNLVLYGPARLEREEPVKLRRRGLALLYYLALEGPTRRERVADLFWAGGAAGNNLRVELHHLRKHLAELGVSAFEEGENLLQLPQAVALDRTPRRGEALEGLEDLSPEFQDWLEAQRARLEGESEEALLEKLVRETARCARPPYLLFLEAHPGDDAVSFAQSLARELRLPFVQGESGRGAALYYLSNTSYSQGLLERILSDRESVWVVRRSAFGEDPRSTFGEDPRLFLNLRGKFSPQRTRYLKLPSLTWSEARDGPLRALPFCEAALLFERAGGRFDILKEYLHLRPPEGFDELPSTPQRVLALYRLEMRHLSPDARLALEHLSIHPGPLPRSLTQRPELEPHLDELERHGWLSFRHGWRWASEVVRRVVYDGMQAGRRARYHSGMAERFREEKAYLHAAYHSYHSGAGLEDALLAPLAPWARAVLTHQLRPERGASPTRVSLRPGPELALLGTRRGPLNASFSETRVVWAHGAADGSYAEWELPDEPCLLHVRGCAFVDNFLGVGLSGEALPLELTLFGGEARCVVFAKPSTPRVLSEDHLLLPLHREFDYWLHVSGQHLVAKSMMEAGVIELELSAHSALQNGPGGTLQAYDLTRPYRALPQLDPKKIPNFEKMKGFLEGSGRTGF